MKKIRLLFVVAFLSCILLVTSVASVFVCVFTKAYKQDSINDCLRMHYYDACVAIADDCAQMLDGNSFVPTITAIRDKYKDSIFGVSLSTYAYQDSTSDYEDIIVTRQTYHYNSYYDGGIIYQLTDIGSRSLTITVSIVNDNSNPYIYIWNNRYNFIISAIFMGMIFIGSISLISVFAKKAKPLPSPEFINKCPSYKYVLMGSLTILLLSIYIFITYKLTLQNMKFHNPFMVISIIISAAVITAFAGGIARRVALKRLYQESLIYKAGQKYGAMGQGLMLCGYCVVIIVAGVLLSIYVWKPFFIITTAIIIALWLLHIRNIHKLNYLIEKYCNGDWSEYPTTDPLLIGNIFNSLYKLSASMQATVEKSVRDERTKTELITNVSHDIKTPLTSIINYTDLLKREDLSEEDRTEYLNVLSKNSARMKKLIEDLIEASKTATGNIELHPIECSIDTLLSQAVAEREPDASFRKLKFVFTRSKEPVIITIDGERLYRVFDNLLSNAVKYSLSGSRIYIDLYSDDMVHIKFKNITENQITISPEELTERFVKGDMSRNSEGSGLGLAICKNLVELMGGKLELNIDGDQFMVELIFPLQNA